MTTTTVETFFGSIRDKDIEEIKKDIDKLEDK